MLGYHYAPLDYVFGGYYRPDLQRWLSRDPSEKQEG